MHAIGASQVGVVDRGGANDLDGPGAGAVPSGHFVVELRDGARQFHVSELAVHVVRARARRITQPNAVILDRAHVLFEELDAIEDFARRLFHLAKLVHVIPELGFSNDLVGSEDDHSVSFGVGMILCGGLATDHLETTQLSSGDCHVGVCVFFGLCVFYVHKKVLF